MVFKERANQKMYLSQEHVERNSQFHRTPVKLLIAGEYIASAIVLFPSYIQVSVSY